MGFTDAENRFLNALDEWKTTPPDDDAKPIGVCYECGKEIYEFDDVWEFEGEYYCEKCVDNHKVDF